MSATAAAIRNQIASLIEAITPLTDATKFRQYRNEGDGDFRRWSESATTGCLRRFQVREVGTDETIYASSTTQETVRVTLEIVIAYSQTQRYGKDGAMDRDDVMREDMLKINAAVGIYGRANFTGGYDCTPLGAEPTTEIGNGVDFLVVRAEYEYLRSVT